MDRQQILLAKSLEAAGVPLQVDTFDERLVLQKAVYLIQSAGVHTNYRYRWYLRGPYSPDLTSDAYGVIQEGEPGQKQLARWNLDAESAKRLDKLKPLLSRAGEATAQKALRLELLASVLFLIETEQTNPSDYRGTSKILKNNRKDFDATQVQEAVQELKSHGFLA